MRVAYESTMNRYWKSRHPCLFVAAVAEAETEAGSNAGVVLQSQRALIEP